MKVFWLRINCSQKKSYFANWCPKGKNRTFKVNFLRQIWSSDSFWIFFSLKNRNIGAHFLLLTFLMTSIFKSLYFPRWRPIFDSSPLLQFSKFNNFIWLIFLILYPSLENSSTSIAIVGKDYYIDGQNTQMIFLFKMTTGGGKKAPQITPWRWIFWTMIFYNLKKFTLRSI